MNITEQTRHDALLQIARDVLQATPKTQPIIKDGGALSHAQLDMQDASRAAGYEPTRDELNSLMSQALQEHRERYAAAMEAERAKQPACRLIDSGLTPEQKAYWMTPEERETEENR